MKVAAAATGPATVYIYRFRACLQSTGRGSRSMTHWLAQQLLESLRANRVSAELVEVNAHINDLEFAALAAQRLIEIDCLPIANNRSCGSLESRWNTMSSADETASPRVLSDR